MTLSPNVINNDRQRRLTIIVTGFFGCLTAGATLLSRFDDSAQPLAIPELIASLILSILFGFAQRGYHVQAARILLCLVFGLYSYVILTLSISLTVAELFAVSTVALAGVVLRGRFVLTYTVIVAVFTIVVNGLRAANVLQPGTNPQLSYPAAANTVSIALLFVLIGIGIWLANCEIEMLMAKTQLTEQALIREKHLLERRVRQRTKELELAHLEQSLQDQRFIHFGQLYANLIHDLLNPLTTASLQLDRLNNSSAADALPKAQASLKHIEHYIVSARQHLNGQSRCTTFDIKSRLSEATSLTKYTADKKGIRVSLQTSHLTLYCQGDAIRFTQVVTHLLLNAMQSYGLQMTKKPITVAYYADRGTITITIRDYGRGMSADELSVAFEPFHSHRADGSEGLGIGLYLAHQYITTDLGGTINIISSGSKAGTIVTITLPEANASKYSLTPS